MLLELARRGVTRDDAYGWVQRAAMAARDGKGDFRTLLRKDPDIGARLNAEDLDRCFDLRHHLRHVDTLFKRTFGRA